MIFGCYTQEIARESVIPTKAGIFNGLATSGSQARFRVEPGMTAPLLVFRYAIQ